MFTMASGSTNQPSLQIAQDFRRWGGYALDIGEYLNNGALSNMGGGPMEQQLNSIVERMESIRKEREKAHAEHMRLLDEMTATIRKLNEVKSNG